MSTPSPADVACPLPFADYERVVLGHGSGGRLSRELLDGNTYPPRIRISGAKGRPDQAVLAPIIGRPALTTDSFVVRPLFFPGGDIRTIERCSVP